MFRLILLCALLFLGATRAFAQVPELRIGALKFGTVNWELDALIHHGFDERNGFKLSITPLAGSPATKIAFQGREVDIIMSDWIWVARQRASGFNYTLFPYSKAVGGLMLPWNSDIDAIGKLADKKIGIAGGPLDKSWLIFRAYAQRSLGLDLKAQSEQVFGGAPLIYQSALKGELDAAINFWHFGAKMKAAGMRELISVSQAAEAMGLDASVPLLGYVFHGDAVAQNPELYFRFALAVQQVKMLLASSDAEWDRLRPLMKPKDDAEFLALREGFREGIPQDFTVDESAAARTFSLMAEVGGSDLVGPSKSLPEGVFISFVP